MLPMGGGPMLLYLVGRILIMQYDSSLTVGDISESKIAERGTHAELLDDGGIYQELYETQFGKALVQE